MLLDSQVPNISSLVTKKLILMQKKMDIKNKIHDTIVKYKKIILIQISQRLYQLLKVPLKIIILITK